MHNAKGGWELSSDTIGTATAADNRFNDIFDPQSIYCILFGNDSYASQEGRGDYTVHGNIAENIISTGSATEVHLVMLYGLRASVKYNKAKNLYNGGTTGAESIYGKCRFWTCSDNVLEDAGYSLDGAIALKGQTRAETDAPQGYAVICSDNVVRFVSHVRDKAVGIGIRNESVLAHGNIVEGDSDGALLLNVTNGSAGVSMLGNLSVRSTASAPFRVITEVDTLEIAHNTVQDYLGPPEDPDTGSKSPGWGVIILLDAGAVRNFAARDNTIVGAADSTASYLGGVIVNVMGATLKRVSLIGNTVDMEQCGAVSSRGIGLAGTGTIDTLLVTNNVTGVAEREFYYADNIAVTGEAKIEGNNFRAPIFDTSVLLEQADCGRSIVQRNDVTSRHTLPAARPGLNFKAVRAHAGASVMGFARSGTNTFRGGATEATISVPGEIAVRCYEAGIWDVVSAAGAVSYA